MGRPWSKRDERRLREIYPTHTEKQCAAILGRPSGFLGTGEQVETKALPPGSKPNGSEKKPQRVYP